MIEEHLTDLLERAAERHPVAPPPLDTMLARSRSARKRRAGVLTLAASLVVGSLIAGTEILVDRGEHRETPVNAPSSKQVVLDGEWRVTALTNGRGKSLLISDKVRVVFKEGKVGGRTECNDFGLRSPYRQTGAGGRDLIIPNSKVVGSTLVGCAESPIVRALGAVRHASESRGVLRLQDENRVTIATLHRIGTAGNGFTFPLPGDEPQQGLDALAVGVLHFTGHNCPYLEDSSGSITPLNFAAGVAHGSGIRDRGRSIVGTDGRVWGREGQKVWFGGGPYADQAEYIDCGAPTGGVPFVAESFLPYLSPQP